MTAVNVSDLIGKTHSNIGRCKGLAETVCRRIGISLPDLEVPEDVENNREIRTDLKNKFEKVENPQLGDIVHIRSMDGGHHVGVVISRTHFIHSTDKHGVHLMRLDSAWVRSRIRGFYRVTT